MIKNLLLSVLMSSAIGVSAFGNVSKEESFRPITPNSGEDFRLISEIFPVNSITYNTNNNLVFTGTISYPNFSSFPDFEYFYIGDYIYNDSLFPITAMHVSATLIDGGWLEPIYSVYPDSVNYLPFYTGSMGGYNSAFSSGYINSCLNEYAEFKLSIEVEFNFSINYNFTDRINSFFRSNVGFGTQKALISFVDQIKDIAYNDGFTSAEVASGTWLGQMVFGTIGGMVGFLFAISDFEVLGVSIMSIITLFVAISILILLIKVLK